MHRPPLAKVKDLHAQTYPGKNSGLAHTDPPCSPLAPPNWGLGFSTTNYMVPPNAHTLSGKSVGLACTHMGN